MKLYHSCQVMVLHYWKEEMSHHSTVTCTFYKRVCQNASSSRNITFPLADSSFSVLPFSSNLLCSSHVAPAATYVQVRTSPCTFLRTHHPALNSQLAQVGKSPSWRLSLGFSVGPVAVACWDAACECFACVPCESGLKFWKWVASLPVSGVGSWWPLMSLPTQSILWFCYPMKQCLK